MSIKRKKRAARRAFVIVTGVTFDVSFRPPEYIPAGLPAACQFCRLRRALRSCAIDNERAIGGRLERKAPAMLINYSQKDPVKLSSFSAEEKTKTEGRRKRRRRRRGAIRGDRFHELLFLKPRLI